MCEWEKEQFLDGLGYVCGALGDKVGEMKYYELDLALRM
jgi:hypothetical protein